MLHARTARLIAMIVTLMNSPVIAADDAVWPMHSIDARFRGANALGTGDVNNDGLLDFVTNYEFDQRYEIALHPGETGDLRAPWPTVTIWRAEGQTADAGVNPENAALGDFDGDGRLDVVAAQGWSSRPFWEGSAPGIRFFWGPAEAAITQPGAWVDAGRIPASIDRGHFIYVRPFDINGDGALDVLSGGRVHGGNGRRGGVVWIEAPRDVPARRDLTQWRIHDIDPDQWSAHNLVLEDIDEDGDMDIALANADWDTPEDQEEIVWYENPGPRSPALSGPWPKHLVYRGPEFYAKPALSFADLDGDGTRDLLTQTERDIYWFRKTGTTPVAWIKVTIQKDPRAQWLARPLRAGDLNADGRIDLVGMLTHRDGVIPADKAAAFWMEYTGERPETGNWTTHAIRWGSGKPMGLAEFGEKWDQLELMDIDGDADPDLVANFEEWWDQGGAIKSFWQSTEQAIAAVVWFENRINQPPRLHRETGGVCTIEAEAFTHLRDGSWVQRNVYPGNTGAGFLQDHAVLDTRSKNWDATHGAEYRVSLDGGNYALWARRRVPKTWGRSGGAGNADSAWFRIGEGAPQMLENLRSGETDRWAWARVTAPITLAAGEHTLTVRVKEAGFALDRMVLARDPQFQPQD